MKRIYLSLQDFYYFNIWQLTLTLWRETFLLVLDCFCVLVLPIEFYILEADRVLTLVDDRYALVNHLSDWFAHRRESEDRNLSPWIWERCYSCGDPAYESLQLHRSLHIKPTLLVLFAWIRQISTTKDKLCITFLITNQLPPLEVNRLIGWALSICSAVVTNWFSRKFNSHVVSGQTGDRPLLLSRKCLPWSTTFYLFAKASEP